MNRRWCVREGIFERDNSLWWLCKEQYDAVEQRQTPMSIALQNGGVSGVLDARSGGFSIYGRRRGLL